MDDFLCLLLIWGGRGNLGSEAATRISISGWKDSYDNSPFHHLNQQIFCSSCWAFCNKIVYPTDPRLLHNDESQIRTGS